jgi:hypothetical protein
MAESAASAVVVFDSKIKFSPGAGLSISVTCAKVCGHLVRFRTIQVCPKDGRTFLTADFFRQQTGSRRGSLAGMIGSVGGRNPVFDLRRRDFITLIGAASAWPLGALLIVAALVAAIPALAHSWYPLGLLRQHGLLPGRLRSVGGDGFGLVLRPDRQLVQA